jgi:hypothetical protein
LFFVPNLRLLKRSAPESHNGFGTDAVDEWTVGGRLSKRLTEELLVRAAFEWSPQIERLVPTAIPWTIGGTTEIQAAVRAKYQTYAARGALELGDYSSRFGLGFGVRKLEMKQTLKAVQEGVREE